MTKKTNNTENHGQLNWLNFDVILGLVTIAGIFIFPHIAISLLIGGLFFVVLAPASTRHSYWKSVGPVRGKNYASPFDRHERRRANRR